MLRGQARPPRRQRHAVSDDEGGVEADTKLPDEVRVLGLVRRQALEELARSRLGDGADLVDDFLSRHADAVVRDADRARRLVVSDTDPELRIVLEEGRIGQRLEAELVSGIGSIGHQLAQEDFLVAIQRVHHQVQQLFHLGLKAERLSLSCHGRHVYVHRAPAPGSRVSGFEAALCRCQACSSCHSVARR